MAKDAVPDSNDGDIATPAVPGSFLTEFDFFHRPSRTLVLTDLIENFEPRKLGPMMRFLTWIGGVQDPDGQMPRDLRLTFSRHKAEMRKAAETMIAWQPERIIIAHGALVRERRHRRASPRVPMDIR